MTHKVWITHQEIALPYEGGKTWIIGVFRTPEKARAAIPGVKWKEGTGEDAGYWYAEGLPYRYTVHEYGIQ